MKRRPAIMSKCHMIGATEHAVAYIKDILKLADDIQNDTQRKQRLEKQNCKRCFYQSRLGGAAMTEQPCMCCSKNEMYGSTATDVLCLECAKKHDLCKHCGGDLEMRTRRKNWPQPEVNLENTTAIG